MWFVQFGKPRKEGKEGEDKEVKKETLQKRAKRFVNRFFINVKQKDPDFSQLIRYVFYCGPRVIYYKMAATGMPRRACIPVKVAMHPGRCQHKRPSTAHGTWTFPNGRGPSISGSAMFRSLS
jgi:hypothetical protein